LAANDVDLWAAHFLKDLENGLPAAPAILKVAS
jgi:hypothetical protein